ncbi:hypothetical protein BX600DRAFT_385602 [Xylariales sp. PMI_506]|nr:hypothetical protein BX600DRAFT_385602 [Xylariales sp. PMI_506]
MTQNQINYFHSLNAAALRCLISQPISADMVTYVSDTAAAVLWCDPSLKFPQDGSSLQPSSGGALQANEFLPSLHEFISELIQTARVPTPTFLSTLVYLMRLKARLPPSGYYGARCTAHRIFLSILILTSKYFNDQSPSNKAWAEYIAKSAGGTFFLGISDIVKLEIQTLNLLEWNLNVTIRDLYLTLEPMLKPIRERLSCKISSDRGSPSSRRNDGKGGY